MFSLCPFACASLLDTFLGIFLVYFFCIHFPFLTSFFQPSSFCSSPVFLSPFLLNCPLLYHTKMGIKIHQQKCFLNSKKVAFIKEIRLHSQAAVYIWHRVGNFFSLHSPYQNQVSFFLPCQQCAKVWTRVTCLNFGLYPIVSLKILKHATQWGREAVYQFSDVVLRF